MSKTRSKKRKLPVAKAAIKEHNSRGSKPTPKANPGQSPVQASDPKAHRHHRIERRLNVPLALGTLIAVAVLAPTLYFVHGFQLSRTSTAFLTRADELAHEEEWLKSADYVQKYLRVRPQDTTQRIRLAELFGKAVAENPRLTLQAMTVYREAIIAAHSNPKKAMELRRELCELLVKSRQFRKAELATLEQPADVVPETDGRHLPIHPADRQLLGRAIYGRFLLGTVSGPFRLEWPNSQPKAWRNEVWSLGTLIEIALKANPADHELSLALAVLLRDHPGMLASEQAEASAAERSVQADSIIDRMITTSPDDVDTLLAAFRYRVRYERPQAGALLDRAIEVAPERIDVLLTAARRARAKAAELSADQLPANPQTTPSADTVTPEAADDAQVTQQLARSEAFYRQALELDPKLETAYVELGDLLRQQGELDRAVKVWTRGAKLIEQAPLLLMMLADGLLSQGNVAQAEKILSDLGELIVDENPLQLQKNSLVDLQRSADLLQAKKYLQLNSPAKAIRHLRRVLPGLSSGSRHIQFAYEANRMLGQAYARLQLWDQVAEAHEAIVGLSIANVSPTHRLAAAMAWRRAGLPARATNHYRLILGQRDEPELWLMLAQATLEVNSMLPFPEQDWSGFTTAIAHATSQREQSDRQSTIRWRAELLSARARWLQTLATGRSEDRDAAKREVEAQIESMVKANSASREFWTEAAKLYQLLGNGKQAIVAADKVIALSDKKNTDGIALKVSLLASQQDLDQARQLVLQSLSAADKESKTQLRKLLARVELMRSQVARATGGSSSLDNTEQLSIPALLQLAEADLARGRDDATKWLSRIRELEGQDGTTWRYVRGRQLLVKLANHPPRPGKSESDPRVIELIQIVAALEQDRPYWAPTHLLKAMTAQARRRADEAIAAYQRAIDLGERRVFVFEQLARLMWATGKPGVESVLARLGTRVPVDPELSAISILSAAQENDMSAALVRAAEAVKLRPKDPMAYLWHAQILALQSQEEAAEQQLIKATEIAPENARTWTALIAFYLQRDRTDDADAAVRQLEAKAAFKSEAQQEYLLAQIVRQMGRQDEAAKRLERAVSLADDDETKAAVLVQAARLDLNQQNLKPAIEKLERAVGLVPNLGQTRRMLAAALAARGEGSDYDRAIELLEETGESTGDQALDQRLKGLLLARRADASYRENVAVAEEIYQRIVDQQSSAADRIFLANLYFIRSQLEPPGAADAAEATQLRADLLKAADEQYRAAANTIPPDPQHVARYIGFLLLRGERDRAVAMLSQLRIAVIGDRSDLPARLARYGRALWELGFRDQSHAVATDVDRRLKELRGKATSEDLQQAIRLHLVREHPDAAAPWISALEKLQPESLQTLELKVKWLQASGMSDIAKETNRFAERYLANPKNAARKVGLYQALAVLCGQIEEYTESERWARRLYKANPNGYRILATSLVMQDRYREALDVCKEALPSVGRPEAVSTMASILTQQPKLDPRQVAEVNELLKEALDEAPDDVKLLTAAGTLRAKQQQVDGAVKLYQRALDLSRRNVLVLNNMATLLAETPNRTDEAIRYADYTLMYSGVSAAVLDTKGTALIRAGRYEEAIELLEMATRAPADSDPRYAFHLAVALHHTGEHSRAKQLLQQALANDLESQLLTPADRDDLARLRNEK